MSLATRFDALLDVIGQFVVLCADLAWNGCRWVRWNGWRALRRRFGKGTLPPVYQTPEGVLVDRVERVPIRSTKADAKRRALVWARQRWNDPAMTWGQARKRIKRLERELREQGADVGEMAVAAEESE